MLERHFNSFLEHDWVVDVPAIRAGLAPDDSSLIEIRNAKIRGTGLLQAPSGKKVVLGSRSPNRRCGFLIDVDLFVTFTKPCGAARPHCEHRTYIMSFAFRFEHDVILALLNRIF